MLRYRLTYADRTQSEWQTATAPIEVEAIREMARRCCEEGATFQESHRRQNRTVRRRTIVRIEFDD